ncbi:plasmid pRiA4b ORF-3 family protein [Fibrobacter sp.]|uniref:plasmid pRiA4b ORF-3 family protein n=1 Tax=Fibrobacter sp. TaxID=35828 RepID=UPI00388D3569
MTPEELEAMDAFEKEFDRMPEEMQEALVEMVKQLKKMPENKRAELFEAFDKLSALMEDREGKTDFEENDFDEDEDYGDVSNYSHFLPSDEVQKYTLRVTLKGLKPAIYRKFNVPSNISLRLLSELIIDLVGWEGSHLNQFRKGDDYYAPAYQRENEMPMIFGPARNHNQEEFALSDILCEKGKTIEWEYDFGDSWLHEVRLSSIGEYAEGEAPISFVKGDRACPPEDCGGIWGYEDLLEIRERWLKYTAHAGKRPSRDDLERLEWYDMNRDFDPEEFDTDYAREICDDFCK